jgi:D-alanyl-lipoteichoic acid acyltransferase DltB (MBOAT superfamily)
LVAGPIERATHLLPQIQKERVFDYSKAVNGLKQILWGFFKKMVIADNCATYVNPIFAHSSQFSGSTLAVGAILFAFQIYADFSGYSDIALGTSRLLGIEVLRNFAFPYFSRDIAEFWRRWHISLTSWFRDYVYIPLGGSKGSRWLRIRNIFIIFLLSGFWHGANWTFIAWGILNAVYFLPLMLLKKNRDHLDTVAEGKYLPGWKDFLAIVITFGLTTFGWIFFRANSITDAVNYISGIFSRSFFTLPSIPIREIALLITFFMIVEWSGRKYQYALEGLAVQWPRPLRWSMYYGIILAILYFTAPQQKFIYFQF